MDLWKPNIASLKEWRAWGLSTGCGRSQRWSKSKFPDFWLASCHPSISLIGQPWHKNGFFLLLLPRHQWSALHGNNFILQIEKANFIVSNWVLDILVGSCGLKSGILVKIHRKDKVRYLATRMSNFVYGILTQCLEWPYILIVTCYLLSKKDDPKTFIRSSVCFKFFI